MKPKPTLVRLPQNGNLRKPLSLGSPLRAGLMQGTPLQSFKDKRDLTLGAGKLAATAAGAVGGVAVAAAAEKKKFVPNLNVTRNIKKEGSDTTTASKLDKPDKGGKRDRKENKHEKREKHHKDRPALIQTLGSVFADGVGGDGGIRRRGGGGGGGYREASDETGGGLARPKLELNIKVDREAEEERLKSLLRDDFIDDLKEGSFVPVQLPMIETGKMFSEVKKAENPDEDGDIKPKRLNKKTNVLDSDDDEDVDDPSSIHSKAVISDKKQAEGEGEASSEYTVADLVRAQRGEIFFIQLPDHLPQPLAAKPPPSDQRAANAATTPDNCSLSRLQEGLMGRLQIRQSGRCQLVLGDQVMDVEVGTKVGFLQDAVSVRMPEGDGGGVEGCLTVLGHVRHRLVVSPDWDSLLHTAGLNRDLA